jgi:type III restriction enzyme
MSQLLCEQVVGRGLRRSTYEIGDDGRLSEEVAKVFGVPFEVIPFKENTGGSTSPPVKRYHVHAVPEKTRYAISYPRVEGTTRLSATVSPSSGMPSRPSSLIQPKSLLRWR